MTKMQHMEVYSRLTPYQFRDKALRNELRPYVEKEMIRVA